MQNILYPSTCMSRAACCRGQPSSWGTRAASVILLEIDLISSTGLTKLSSWLFISCRFSAVLLNLAGHMFLGGLVFRYPINEEAMLKIPLDYLKAFKVDRRSHDISYSYILPVPLPSLQTPAHQHEKHSNCKYFTNLESC